ncbi:recombinase zinc beta ribbon domain-containing protein [Thalassobaculum salexigens]|uniref:recombinase zinc beta ribbon domain-containing protein n=1 Tax=Thalassobaculum salexigens TaxID=455360 RepID=UPI003CCC3DFA
MRARVENGFYCFGKIVGYSYEKHPSGGKVLTPEEPQASIIREAFEGLASGRFQNAAEVTRFFNGFAEFRTKQRGQANWQRTFNVLRNPLYAGLVNVPRLGVHMKPGQHAAIVSVATWQKAQDRLDGRALAPAREDIRDDFILRGFVCCDGCGNPMTAAWSKGRSALYGYYKCFKRECDLYGKSIRKDKVEGDFEALLQSVTPGPALVKIARAMFADAWEQQAAQAQGQVAGAKRELRVIDSKIAKLVERTLQTDQTAIIAAYEREIEKLELAKAGLREIAAKNVRPATSFEESFRTALTFLSNPWKIWDSGRVDYRRLVLRLTFLSPVRYCRNEGFRTAAIAEPLRVLGLYCGGKSRMVGAAGIEPATPAV